MRVARQGQVLSGRRGRRGAMDAAWPGGWWLREVCKLV